MKCPKCGYNSFEYHDACKKCANDLTGYKNTYGLKAIVMPQEARSSMAAALMEETAASHQAPETADETAADMFSFDLPDDESASGATTASDPFDFGEEPATSEAQGFGEFSFDDERTTAQAKAEEDAFADLLESSSQEGASSAAPAAATATGSAGEFDLSSFSWDDAPAAPAATAAETKVEDDFNSLFGDLDDATKK
jgi:predicted  nucleic acid-binding Zn-ribbon protein